MRSKAYFLFFWAATSVVVAVARPEFARYQCAKQLAASGRPFQRAAFLFDLSHTTFFDNDGHPFWFAGGYPTEILLSVRHAVHGLIRGTRFFDEGFEIFPDGSIHTGYVTVDLKQFQKRGIFTSLFTYLRDHLPDGVTFTVIDTSDSKCVGHGLRHLREDQLAQFAETPAGAQLYAMYRRVRAATGPEEAALTAHWDSQSAAGFSHYLCDVSTIWGRIARHGNFRRDYRPVNHAPENAIFQKFAIPPELRTAEGELLSALDTPTLIRTLLPPPNPLLQCDSPWNR